MQFDALKWQQTLSAFSRYVQFARFSYRARMRWEALFDDLESQLAAFELAERAASVGELTRAERATVTLDGRLRAALGSRLTVRLRGGEQQAGELLDVASEWLLLGDGARRLLIPARAVAAISGLGVRVEPAVGGVLRRLTLGHALRALSRDRVAVRVSASGVEVRGRLDAVGADHVDVTTLDDTGRGCTGAWTVPLAAVDVVASA